ncbi:MAG TPA: hypothetical protein VL461_03810 [Dictyobacter sp.]|jgi:hypothetical protein|nr:hypothetical protein [Dictyobacter sp.]
MPVQDFALDTTATNRLQVKWDTQNDPVSVRFNASSLGILISVNERVIGKTFALPNGSAVFIRFVNGMPQAFLNGYQLMAVEARVDPKPGRFRKRGGYLSIWIIANIVLVVVSTLLISRFFLFSLIAAIGIVGLVALWAWKKWGFYLLIGYVALNFVMALILGLTRTLPFVFLPMVSLGLFYFWLWRSNTWNLMN